MALRSLICPFCHQQVFACAAMLNDDPNEICGNLGCAYYNDHLPACPGEGARLYRETAWESDDEPGLVELRRLMDRAEREA